MKNTDFKLEITPTILVIFGISGDLSQRKLLPALYELEKNNLLHPETRIVGVTRKNFSVADLLIKAVTAIKQKDHALDQIVIQRLSQRFSLCTMDITNSADYPLLIQLLDDLEAQAKICLHQLFYLAIPPQISSPVITNLGQNGLNRGCSRHSLSSHLLIEKPFGFDLNTAQDLIQTVRRYFKEDQVFYIDHYLAKETAQNIVTFRFHNPIFANIWDSDHISSIEVTAAEQIDIAGRANFYEQTGALRDLVQSHLLHLLSLVMMDRPADLTSSQDIHKQRLQVLTSIEPVPVDKIEQRVVKGQYQGYNQEVAHPTTSVETYVALKLFSKDPRWATMPIYLKTGKALSQKTTCITVTFTSHEVGQQLSNRLEFHIQPNESIVVQLWTKKPGFNQQLQTAPMHFNYQQIFDNHGHPDAYERVLMDAIRGDNTLFATSESILASWKILQPVLDNWQNNPQPGQIYAKGSDGPDLSQIQ